MSYKKKVSRKKIKSFAKEEKKSSKEYARLGFKDQARDEHKHHEYFESLLKKKKKRVVNKPRKKKLKKKDKFDSGRFIKFFS